MNLRQLPLLCLSCVFLIGIAVGGAAAAFSPLWVSAGLAVFAALLWQLEHRWKMMGRLRARWQQFLPLSFSWMVLFFALGMLRYALVLPQFDQHDLAWYHNNGKSVIIARVIRPPVIKDEIVNLTVAVQSIELVELGPHSTRLDVKGKMRVITRGDLDLHYGDAARLYCEPRAPENFDGFDYQRYLAAQGIYSTCDFAVVERIGSGGNVFLRWIYGLRSLADERIRAALPADEGALLSGILLGIEEHIAPGLDQAFRLTGTSHIIAISGANFTLLLGLVSTLLRRWVPRRRQLPVMLGVIVFYAVFVGGNPAVLRAAFMGGLALFGRYIGRRGVGINSLGFAAAVLCLMNPYLLWDVGFQLSFMATLGLVLFSDPLLEGFKKLAGRFIDEEQVERAAGPVGEYALMTAAAQLTTMPLIAYHFQQVSLSSFLVNLLILPAQPLIMGLGVILLPLILAFPALGMPLTYLLFPLLRYTIRLVEWFARWRGGSLTIGAFSGWWLLGYYVLIMAPTFLRLWHPTRKRRLRPVYALVGAGLLVAVSWNAVLNLPDASLHVFLPDLQDSSAVLIQFPTGQAMLLEGAESGRELERALEQRMIGYQLDQIAVRSDAKKQLDGLLPIVDRYRPRQIWVPDAEMEEALRQRLTRNQWMPEIDILCMGQGFRVDEDLELRVLYADEQAAALELIWSETRIVFPGGVSHSVLSQIAPETLLQAAVLVLTEADLEDGSLGAWGEVPAQVMLVDGSVAVCAGQCAATADHGWIELRTDGTQLWVEAER
ncbi:MAG: ComEC family competence protein [Anaerolineaceae bacterium]|nr:ComEC family competence protein [Anaerolineaceae bacterium]